MDRNTTGKELLTAVKASDLLFGIWHLPQASAKKSFKGLPVFPMKEKQ